MQIFALETNIDRLKEKLFSHDEREIFTVRRHSVLFLLRSVWYGLLTIILIALVIFSTVTGLLDPLIMIPVTIFLWLAFVFLGWLQSFINWRYDCIILTTEKLMIVDQTSIIRRTITSLNLDSISQVNARSQWLNIFGFGELEIAQRDVGGESVRYPYLPDVDGLVRMISDQIVVIQSRHISSSPTSV